MNRRVVFFLLKSFSLVWKEIGFVHLQFDGSKWLFFSSSFIAKYRDNSFLQKYAVLLKFSEVHSSVSVGEMGSGYDFAKNVSAFANFLFH